MTANYETAPSGEPQKKKVSSSKITSFPGYKGKEENKKKEEEENVGEDSSSGDSVQVETQEKESSIAEAKPVGEYDLVGRIVGRRCLMGFILCPHRSCDRW